MSFDEDDVKMKNAGHTTDIRSGAAARRWRAAGKLGHAIASTVDVQVDIPALPSRSAFDGVDASGDNEALERCATHDAGHDA